MVNISVERFNLDKHYKACLPHQNLSDPFRFCFLFFVLHVFPNQVPVWKYSLSGTGGSFVRMAVCCGPLIASTWGETDAHKGKNKWDARGFWWEAAALRRSSGLSWILLYSFLSGSSGSVRGFLLLTAPTQRIDSFIYHLSPPFNPQVFLNPFLISWNVHGTKLIHIECIAIMHLFQGGWNGHCFQSSDVTFFFFSVTEPNFHICLFTGC